MDEVQDQELTPQWGALPGEQYLIENWDYNTSLSAGDQRLALIRAFIQLPAIPEEYDGTSRGLYQTVFRPPTPAEINLILLPWRPLKVRRQALGMWTQGPDSAIPILRTDCTYPNGNDRLDEFMEVESGFPGGDSGGENEDWCLLKDQRWFNFGDHWASVFDLIPELIGPLSGVVRGAGLLEGGSEKGREEFHELMRMWREEDPDGWMNGLDQPDGEFAGVAHSLHHCSMEAMLLVVDRQAFETGELLLLWLDKSGNVVRHTRIEPQWIGELRIFWTNASYVDTEYWCQASVGGKYLIDGEIGRRLYQIELT